KPDEWFRSEAGRGVTLNILSWQSAAGSWPKNTNTAAAPFTGDAKQLKGTFDNRATTSELRFLARAFRATADPVCKQAFLKGIDHILNAQYRNGGWPQYSPPGSGYARHITFNDDATVRLMELMREIAEQPDYEFVGKDRREAAREAFARGVDCILKCQVRVDGRLTAWCAQHDENDFRPRPARSFELASLSGFESVGIVKLLMSIPQPNERVVQAVESAVAWLDSVRLAGIRQVEEKDPNTPKGYDKKILKDPNAPPLWARFYEIGTNQPLFVDRDGTPKYQLSEIGYERRNGYAWLGDWPADLLQKEYPAWKKRLAPNATQPPSAP
ncbi:MAG: pectate lyase, partial [Verrucomicrobiota bacterium]